MIFGADYYPEQWTEKDWDEDFAVMKKMGLTAVRMAEFAWAVFEPGENVFSFSFFDGIIEKAEKAGIKVILGTPTATFPPWLFKKHPDIVQVTKNGIRRIIGTRRCASFHSDEYLKACSRIVKALAEHYGSHPNIIGWQIDNEIGHEGSDLDYSENALKKFRIWLKDRYGEISVLNQNWGGSFWGIIYNDFDEIHLPADHIASGFNPGMIQDFCRFSSDAAVSFINMQADILRTYIKSQFLTVNLYPSPFGNVIDMAELCRKMDFVSWDNYPVWGSQTEPMPHPFISGCCQYVRGLKDRNFTVMEQISGFQGHTLLGYLPAPGQISLWAANAAFNGAENMVFFRYRTARTGQEQLCYGILDHDKGITDRYLELQKTVSRLNETADDFISEDFTAETAVLYDIENVRNLKYQPISEGLTEKVNDFLDIGFDKEFFTWYAGLNILNVPTHILPASETDLKKYRMIVLPLYIQTDPEFVKRLENFVADGGILVLGYRSGTKQKNGWMTDDVPPGPFKDLAGIKIRKFESLGKNTLNISFGILSHKAGKIAEILEPDTAQVLARYRAKEKFYHGRPAITVNRYKKGRVYYVGTSLEPASFVHFFRKVLIREKLPFRFLGKNIELIRRKGKKSDYEFLLNHSGNSAFAGLERIKPYEFKTRKLEKR
ncbi:MAG TPA: beta-galactosidase [Leptospiraceae bacterium]|nr:beta-galactosidase [Leptospiraceae bacterium]